jgi:putative flippase GtrA
VSQVGAGTARSVRSIYSQFRGLIHELAQFGIAGLATAVEDIGLFNILLHEGLNPILCKAISTTIAALTSYAINRNWAFRHRARTGSTRELPRFIALSAVGLGIVELCLAVSHYGLGLTSPLADNLSANGVGLVLGTIWRYWSFRRWVFLPSESPELADRDAALNAPV